MEYQTTNKKQQITTCDHNDIANSNITALFTAARMDNIFKKNRLRKYNLENLVFKDLHCVCCDKNLKYCSLKKKENNRYEINELDDEAITKKNEKEKNQSTVFIDLESKRPMPFSKIYSTKILLKKEGIISSIKCDCSKVNNNIDIIIYIIKTLYFTNDEYYNTHLLSSGIVITKMPCERCIKRSDFYLFVKAENRVLTKNPKDDNERFKLAIDVLENNSTIYLNTSILIDYQSIRSRSRISSLNIREGIEIRRNFGYAFIAMWDYYYGFYQNTCSY